MFFAFSGTPLLVYRTPSPDPTNMAQYQYPTEIATAAYHAGEETAVADQFLQVCTHFPECAREFAEEAAKAVAAESCEHHAPPPKLEGGLTLAQRRRAAADHVGLCGLYQADVIASVLTGDVLAKWNSTAGTKFRNQVSSLRGGVQISFLVVCNQPLGVKPSSSSETHPCCRGGCHRHETKWLFCKTSLLPRLGKGLALRETIA